MPVPEDVYITPPSTLGSASSSVSDSSGLGTAGAGLGSYQWGGGQAGGGAGQPLGTAGAGLGGGGQGGGGGSSGFGSRGGGAQVGLGQPVDVAGNLGIPQIVGDVLGRGLSAFLNSWYTPAMGFNPFGLGGLGLRPGETEDAMRRRKAEEMAGGGAPIGVTRATETAGGAGAAQPPRINPLTGKPFVQTPGGATDTLYRYQQARQNLEQMKGRPITAAEDAELLNLANASRPGVPIVTPETTPPGGGQPGQPGARWGDVNTISRSLANWNITEAQAFEMAKANLPPGMDINTFWKSILDRVSQMRHGGGGGRSGGGYGAGGGGGGGAPAVTPPPAPGGEPNISPIQPDTTGHFVIPDWYFTNMPQASIDAVVAWLRSHGYQPMTMGRFAPSEWAGAPGQIFTDVNSLPDDPYVRWLFYRMGWTSASAYPEVTA